MINQDQLKALAELDELENVRESGPFKTLIGEHKPSGGTILHVKDYLHSYDAIIPLIQKQCGDNTQSTRVKFLNTLRQLIGVNKPTNKVGTPLVSDFDLIVATPFQLCEALLRATGKWKE